MSVKRTNIRIYADVRKVLLRYLDFGLKTDRITPILNYIHLLSEEEVQLELDKIYTEFGKRHLDINSMFLKNYGRISSIVKLDLSINQQLLLGSYFTHEYSVQASALFNPSIVAHPDQTGINKNELRFIISYRATGEGHISSVVFNSGIIKAQGEIILNPANEKITEGEIKAILKLEKNYILSALNNDDISGEDLPALCTLEQVKKSLELNDSLLLQVEDLFESSYDVQFVENIDISSRILFPYSASERMGMEDVRFVRFSDGDEMKYVGTYTAYNGREIRPQLIITKDFENFSIRTLVGKAASNKGIALFPRKIKGQYVMIGRQDARSLSIMYSDDLFIWDKYTPLQSPKRGWEMLQIGNNGSPIEIDEGWLLLTHAVGPMRKYTLSMTLLDKKDPSVVIASLDKPLMSPNEEEREGYVPNVLYTCGMIAHEKVIYIPYAMSDSAVSFATISIEELLKDLLP